MPDEPRRDLTRSAEDLISDFLNVPRERSRARKRPTQELGSLVESLLLKHQIGRDAPEHTIREHWAEVVGASNAHYSHAAQIDPRGRLIVLTSHSVVQNELFHHRELIVANIRKLPGCGHVHQIHVRSG